MKIILSMEELLEAGFSKKLEETVENELGKF